MRPHGSVEYFLKLYRHSSHDNEKVFVKSRSFSRINSSARIAGYPGEDCPLYLQYSIKDFPIRCNILP